MLAVRNLQGQIKSSSFKFEISPNNIARYPVQDPEDSKMMVIHKAEDHIEHKQFKDLIDYFKDGDVLVINDSKVFPALLQGKKEKNAANIEIILLRELDPNLYLWDVVVEPARKIRVGNKLYFGNEELAAEVEDNTTARGRTIRFLHHGSINQFYNLIHKWGKVPLPKDIRSSPERVDKKAYQSIFATQDRSVNVPDASLLFTRRIIKLLELRGVKIVYVTLHPSLPRFQIINVEDLNKYKVVSENYNIPEETSHIINKALDKGNRVVAMGTSVVRCLESSVTASNYSKPTIGWTDNFIYPPYKFKICSGLITNIHRPMSTSLMMVSAFLGYDLFVKCYHIAQQKKYRFLEYGDSMLIL